MRDLKHSTTTQRQLGGTVTAHVYGAISDAAVSTASSAKTLSDAVWPS